MIEDKKYINKLSDHLLNYYLNQKMVNFNQLIMKYNKKIIKKYINYVLLYMMIINFNRL